MEPSGPAGRELGLGYKYVGLGCTFAGGVVLFMAAGFGLDRWLGTTPLLTVGGTLAGAVLSFLNVYWKLRAEADREAADRRTDGSAHR
jgi:F0F1-type ATP synthase assembly protein I